MKRSSVCATLLESVIYKSHNNLRQTLMKVKSTRPEDKKGVIYEVPCAECNCVYVGETGRSLEVRLKEHRYAVKTKVHADTNNHKVDGKAARVILFEELQTKRKVLESLQY